MTTTDALDVPTPGGGNYAASAGYSYSCASCGKITCHGDHWEPCEEHQPIAYASFVSENE